MKQIVVSVYDSVADQFGAPVCDVNAGSAVRAFVHAVNNGPKDSALSVHPQDFVLFELGEFDTVTGRFVLLEDERQLVRGADVLQRAAVKEG